MENEQEVERHRVKKRFGKWGNLCWKDVRKKAEQVKKHEGH